MSIDDYKTFTIRCRNLEELAEHKRHIERMGFEVGDIERSRGHKQDWLPPETYFFTAKILKKILTEDIMNYLVTWDRRALQFYE